MKSLLLVLLAFSCYANIFAQRKTTVTIKAGNNIMDVIPIADIFYYPQFTSGIVFLRDGTKTKVKMNYNRLVDEMHFINSKGDTLALDNEKTVEYIAIGIDTFYYNEGFVRLISTGNVVKLVVKQIWMIKETRQIGAFNSTNNSVSMVSYKSYNEKGRLYDLTVNEDVILTKVENYYVGDKYNHFVIAGKKNILMLFPKEEKRIGTYLKENKINYNSKEDLEKTVQFIEHL